MSSPPDNNSRPRPNRGGRNRNRRHHHSGPRQEQDHKQNRRNDRRPDRRDNPNRGRNGDRRERRPERSQPAPGKSTVWQKLVTVMTFGLVRPGASSSSKKPQRSKEQQRGPREVRQQSAAPPADPDAVDTDRLHVGNLSYDATENDLLDVFRGIGKVQHVDIVYSGRTHRSKGFGFVQMMNVADARRAVAELHGKSFMGRILHLGPARSRGRDEREADDEQD